MTPELVALSLGDHVLRGHRWPGDRLAVLLLHEPGDDRDLDDWNSLIPYLLGNGCTTIAMDLRGHGASDGDWNAASAVGDIQAFVAAARQESEIVVICATGESAIFALRAADSARVEGLILLSPGDPGPEPPRGAGAAKLIFAGSSDGPGHAAAAKLRQASIGPVLSITVPSSERGAELLNGELALTCREHIVGFLNERRRERTVGPAAPVAPDQFLERLGIRPKGVDR
jgi:pimeloyl-ACP methyl ester carboxylesterase